MEQNETNEYFGRQVIMSADGSVDMALFDYSQAIERFYPPKTVVKVTKGNGSWVGMVRSIGTHRQAGYLLVEHGKSGKRHSVHWTDIKLNLLGAG